MYTPFALKGHMEGAGPNQGAGTREGGAKGITWRPVAPPRPTRAALAARRERGVALHVAYLS